MYSQPIAVVSSVASLSLSATNYRKVTFCERHRCLGDTENASSESVKQVS